MQKQHDILLITSAGNLLWQMLCGETYLYRSFSCLLIFMYWKVCSVQWAHIHFYMSISLQALYQIAVLLIFNFDGKRILHLQNESRENADKIKNTFVFNAFVFCQVSWSLSNSRFQYYVCFQYLSYPDVASTNLAMDPLRYLDIFSCNFIPKAICTPQLSTSLTSVILYHTK